MSRHSRLTLGFGSHATQHTCTLKKAPKCATTSSLKVHGCSHTIMCSLVAGYESCKEGFTLLFHEVWALRIVRAVAEASALLLCLCHCASQYKSQSSTYSTSLPLFLPEIYYRPVWPFSPHLSTVCLAMHCHAGSLDKKTSLSNLFGEAFI